MDSYGIHQAQMAGNSMAGYVNSYNDTIRAHKKSALDTYTKTQADIKSHKDTLEHHMTALTGFDAVNGIHGAYNLYKKQQMWGGVGNAVISGAKANLHSMTGGRYGLPAMGPHESLARGVDPADIDLGAPFKAVGGKIQEGAEARGGKAKSLVGQALESRGARARRMTQQAVEMGDMATERNFAGAEARQATMDRHGVGTPARVGGDGTAVAPHAPATIAESEVEAPRPRREGMAPPLEPHPADIAEAQAKDRAMGIGWGEEAFQKQTDPTKSLSQLAKSAKVGETEEGLNLQGKIMKKGLT